MLLIDKNHILTTTVSLMKFVVNTTTRRERKQKNIIINVRAKTTQHTTHNTIISFSSTLNPEVENASGDWSTLAAAIATVYLSYL